jgi:hypothetical protein
MMEGGEFDYYDSRERPMAGENIGSIKFKEFCDI